MGDECENTKKGKPENRAAGGNKTKEDTLYEVKEL